MKPPPTIPAVCFRINCDDQPENEINIATVMLEVGVDDLSEFPYNLMFKRFVLMRESDFKELVAEIERREK